MDKGRDAKRRGATRFKHSKPKLSSGIVSSEEKREKKLRKLSSVVGRSSSSYEDCEMESLGTGRDEDELRIFGGKNTNTSKRKFFYDSNGVGHASVPRRLRSAMTKRSRDSISPPLPSSKKVKNHIRDGNNSSIKKSKSNMKQGGSERCSKRILSVTITKDEEEVAATLFALAGLFADNKASNDNKSKGKHESLEPNSSDVPESSDSPLPAVEEVSQKDGISDHSSIAAAEAVVPSSSAERLSENVKVESWNEPDVRDGPNLPYSRKIHLSLDDSVSQVSSHSSSAKTETQCDGKPLCSSVKFNFPSDLHSDVRLRHALKKNTSFLERKQEMPLGTATLTGCPVEQPRKLEESKKSGLALWPGLPSTTVSKTARAEDHLLPSSASKLPAWLDAACSGSRHTSIQNDSLAKIGKVTADRRLSKSCATHVYISHLIQALRTSEGEEKSLQLQSQTRTHQGLNQGVLSTINNLNGVESDVNAVVSVSNIGGTNANQSSNVAEIGILQQSNNHDRLQSAAASAVSHWQKQSFDMYMSLARGGGMGVDNSSVRSRHGLESLSPILQNPYLPSLGQHQFGTSFSLPQPCYTSSCSDHFPTLQQVQMQLQSYPTPFYGAQASPPASTKQHRHQQEAQQRLWDAQYRADNAAKPTIQFLNLQSGPTSPRSQQQHPMTVASLPFSAGKVARQERHLPSVYEDHGVGFRTNPLLPLQLLCNERL